MKFKMFKVALLAFCLAAVQSVVADVPVYGQCGGLNWTGMFPVLFVDAFTEIMIVQVKQLGKTSMTSCSIWA